MPKSSTPNLPNDAHSPAATDPGKAQHEAGTHAAPKPWDKIHGETGVAFSAFILFRDLGTARSLSAAYRLHLEADKEKREPGAKRTEKDGNRAATAPDTSRATEAPGRWREWAKKYSWRSRADAYDQNFSAIRLQGAENAAKTFSAEYSEAHELFLAGLLKIQMSFLAGLTSESEKGKGRLMDRTIRRVGRDANGEAVQSEETFSAREQIETVITLNKFLFGELRAKEGAGDSDDGESCIDEQLKRLAQGQELSGDDWVQERVRQVARQQANLKQVPQTPALVINVIKDDESDSKKGEQK